MPGHPFDMAIRQGYVEFSSGTYCVDCRLLDYALTKQTENQKASSKGAVCRFYVFERESKPKLA